MPGLIEGKKRWGNRHNHFTKLKCKEERKTINRQECQINAKRNGEKDFVNELININTFYVWLMYDKLGGNTIMT